MKFKLAVAMVVALLSLFGWMAQSSHAKGNEANGKKLFTTHCFVCHGTEGKGSGPAALKLDPKPRDLTNDSYMSKLSDSRIFAAISEGGPAFHGSVFMPDWAKVMSADEIWDIVAYVRVLHRPPSARGDRQNGEKLYQKYCSSCHGAEGKGDGPLAPVYSPRPQDHTSDKYMSARSDHELFIAISQGGRASGGSQFMPGWGEMLSDKEIWDIVAYIRSLHRRG